MKNMLKLLLGWFYSGTVKWFFLLNFEQFSFERSSFTTDDPLKSNMHSILKLIRFWIQICIKIVTTNLYFYFFLKITVLDRNDNDPVMAQRVYDVAVSESAPLGSEIVKVVANDPDENSELRYEIVSGNVGNVFSISMHQVRLSIDWISRS